MLALSEGCRGVHDTASRLETRLAAPTREESLDLDAQRGSRDQFAKHTSPAHSNVVPRREL